MAIAACRRQKACRVCLQIPPLKKGVRGIRKLFYICIYNNYKMSFIPYNKNLKERARVLRNQGIISEVILWKHIKGDAFNVRFLRQKTILNYIVDFYCPKLKLVLEIDGSSHDFAPQSRYDIDRQNQIEQLGIRFLRFSDYQVKHDIVNVLRQIECVVHELSNF